MKSGRVVRILSETSLVVNLGTGDGVEVGMKFAIYTPGTEIVDPETHEKLGSLIVRKALVEVTSVYDRFAMMAPPEVSAVENPFTALLGSTVSRARPALSVDRDQIEPLPSKGEVTIGDAVVPLAETRKAWEAAQAKARARSWVDAAAESSAKAKAEPKPKPKAEPKQAGSEEGRKPAGPKADKPEAKQ